MRYTSILLILLAIFSLTGCGEARKIARIIDPAGRDQTDPKFDTSTLDEIPIVKAAKDETSRLKREGDRLATLLAINKQQVENSIKNDREKEKEDDRNWVKAKVKYAKIAAWSIFSAGIIALIISFTPIGRFYPVWVGPAGIGGGLVILILSGLFLWVYDRMWWFIIPTVVIMLLCAVIWLWRMGILHNINTKYASDMEAAATDAIKIKAAKIKALEDSFKNGVHNLGQRIRGKVRKTKADLEKLKQT